jgi:hypothetical protein
MTTLGGGGQGWPGVAAPQDRGAARSGAGKEPPASPPAPLPRSAETCAGAMGTDATLSSIEPCSNSPVS